MAKLEIFDGTNWIQLGGTGTVTSVGITGSTGLSVTGSPITSSGTINLSLSNIPISSLENYPVDSSLFLSGDGTWSVPSSITPVINSLPIDGDVNLDFYNLITTGQIIVNTLSNANLDASTNQIFVTSHIDMGGRAVYNLQEPINGLDAATKNYVDSKIGSGSGSGTVTSVKVTAGTGLTVTGSPITTSGTINLTLGSELQALSAFAQTGLIARTGSGMYAGRTLSAGSGISITNGSGVSGDPTISVANIPISSIQNASNSMYFLRGDGQWANTFVASDLSAGILFRNNNINATNTYYGVFYRDTQNAVTFGLKNNTGEGYIWAQEGLSLFFGTNGQTRIYIGTDGVINCYSNNITTTGTLKANNLSAHNSTSITVSSHMDMQTKNVYNMNDPINPQDAATKAYVDSKSTQILSGNMKAYVAQNNFYIMRDSSTRVQYGEIPPSTGSTYGMTLYDPLYITGYYLVSGCNYGWLKSTGPTGTTTNSGGNYSIWAEQRIAASEFNAMSSINKKNVIAKDDEIIGEVTKYFKQLSFSKYEYKDKAKDNSGIQYGIIAEEIRTILPQFVDSSYDFVLDIGINGIANLDDELIKITLQKKHSVNLINETIKVIGRDYEIKGKVIKQKSLTLVIDPILKTEEKAKLLKKDKVYVYGTYKECPTVAKQKLFEMAMQVTQNLLKRVEILEKGVN